MLSLKSLSSLHIPKSVSRYSNLSDSQNRLAINNGSISIIEAIASYFTNNISDYTLRLTKLVPSVRTLLTTSTTANSTTTPAAITIDGTAEFKLPVSANKKYRFESYVRYNTAATTTGLSISVTGPSNIWWGASMQSTAANGTVGNGSGGGFNNASSVVITSGGNLSTTDNIVFISGYCEPAADGNIALFFASEVGSSAVTIQANSVLIVQEVN